MSTISTTARKTRLVPVMAASIICITAASALATFNYDLRFDDGSHSRLVTSADIGHPITLGLWAQITSVDGTFSDDSPSVDALSIVSRNAGGGALAGGGITGATLYSSGPSQPGWDKGSETSAGAASNISDDGIVDWGGTGNEPLAGYIRYKASVPTTGGYFAFPPDQLIASLLPAEASHPVSGRGGAWEWELATLTVTIDALGTSGTTTFVPTSHAFSGVNAAYDLAYFNDTFSLGDADSGAEVTKSQLPPTGVSFVLSVPEPSVLGLFLAGATLLACRRRRAGPPTSRNKQNIIDQPS